MAKALVKLGEKDQAMAVLVNGHNHDTDDEDIILLLSELEKERQKNQMNMQKKVDDGYLTKLPRRSYFNKFGKIDVEQRFEIEKELMNHSNTEYDHTYMKI